MVSFFRKRVSGTAVKAHLERISFLVKYLEQYGMWNKKEVVEVLNKELLLAIPNPDFSQGIKESG
ncbi:MULTISPECIES: hypothetical protein [unclassified Halomonas]|uniref:hypothetical protein n=1 Tax=unclassified Halomonas TaxID=2609666 RepID=UPI001EF4567C|nr:MULTISPECIES: hypothetical protein [unclassified Halomonas]MCG7578437.1 hypothetical protein [Halomonas sp. MMH1-48]MCG7605530.1 hypothetical protein [Halomonas sp. MM17-34]MCG7614732.1 hypothetical protein [Halomonas sp. MM17-29]MCG7621596.1 hypothetical protein [Halomonas sp. DSH1-27]